MNAIWIAVEDDPVVEKIDEILPQSQCGQCGYPGCHPYTEAIGSQDEKINRCAPGGEAVMLKIAALLNANPQPIDGDEQDVMPVRMLTVIDEDNCTGYTKCIQACPVDVVVGVTHVMHTVTSDLRTGCNLCVDPCSTQCIELCPVAETPDSWKWDLNTIPVCIIPVEQHA